MRSFQSIFVLAAVLVLGFAGFSQLSFARSQTLRNGDVVEIQSKPGFEKVSPKPLQFVVGGKSGQMRTVLDVNSTLLDETFESLRDAASVLQAHADSLPNGASYIVKDVSETGIKTEAQMVMSKWPLGAQKYIKHLKVVQKEKLDACLKTVKLQCPSNSLADDAKP